MLTDLNILMRQVPLLEADMLQMKIEFTKYGDDPETDEGTEEFIEMTLPAKYEICTRCEGKGSHTNPSIDGHGISEDEWNGPDWDDESRETYLTGGYDVRCEARCKDGKVVVIDIDALTTDQTKVFEEYMEGVEEDEREAAYDRRTRAAEDGCYEW